jgi:hypothetical protein
MDQTWEGANSKVLDGVRRPQKNAGKYWGASSNPDNVGRNGALLLPVIGRPPGSGEDRKTILPLFIPCTLTPTEH